jgi:hypothetical protein
MASRSKAAASPPFCAANLTAASHCPRFSTKSMGNFAAASRPGDCGSRFAAAGGAGRVFAAPGRAAV